MCCSPPEAAPSEFICSVVTSGSVFLSSSSPQPPRWNVLFLPSYWGFHRYLWDILYYQFRRQVVFWHCSRWMTFNKRTQVQYGSTFLEHRVQIAHAYFLHLGCLLLHNVEAERWCWEKFWKLLVWDSEVTHCPCCCNCSHSCIFSSSTRSL